MAREELLKVKVKFENASGCEVILLDPNVEMTIDDTTGVRIFTFTYPGPEQVIDLGEF